MAHNLPINVNVDEILFNEIFRTDVDCTGLADCPACQAIEKIAQEEADWRDSLLAEFEETLREEEATEFFKGLDAEKVNAAYDAGKAAYRRADNFLVQADEAARSMALLESRRQLESARRMDGYLDYLATPEAPNVVKLTTLEGKVECYFENPDLYAEVKAAQDDFNNYLVSVSRLEEHKRGVADLMRRVDALQQESLCKAYWDTRFAKTPGWLTVAILCFGVVGFFLILFRNA